MSSFSESPRTTVVNERNGYAEDTASYFRRRSIKNWRCLWPRRYVMVLMLFVLLVIYKSRSLNLSYNLIFIIYSRNISPVSVEYPAIGNWTDTELENLGNFRQVGEIFANFLGAILIYQYSSHKYLLITVILSSILHMFMPTALNHHSVFFLLIVMTVEDIISVPAYTAALSMWKDWSPPAERAKLVTFSLCGTILAAIGATVFIIILYASEYFCYYTGIAGLVWALLWYNITSDTPQNDPLITEKELVYLESNIPSTLQEKVKLKNVPWIHIVKSPQVHILSLIFFKLSCSLETMLNAGINLIYSVEPEDELPLHYFLPFLAIFMIILLGSASLMDLLVNKYKYMALKIRKYFLCCGFGLQGLLLLGALSPENHIKAVFYILAYLSFAFSIPGALTFPLDISPRYVAITAGIGFAFSSFGMLCYYYFANLSSSWIILPMLSCLFLFDSLITLSAAIVFGVWGDVEEQRWSFINTSHHRGNDYKSYPQPDDEDDLNLVSGIS